MDKETINIYDQEAENIAKLHASLTPNRIYELISLYFLKDGYTCDIGCGIGRDVHWLNQQGYPCIGVDGSTMMLEQAQSLYPDWQYINDCLPNLKELGRTKFDNILCSAVLMHLNRVDLKSALSRIIELLNDNGCLILSFRGTHSANHREKGKLYEPIEIDSLKVFFQDTGCTVLLTESEAETSRNLTWNNVAIRKSLSLAE